MYFTDSMHCSLLVSTYVSTNQSVYVTGNCFILYFLFHYNFSSLKRGCRSQAKIGTTRGPNGVLRVISFHEEHVEHEVSAEVYETLPGVSLRVIIT